MLSLRSGKDCECEVRTHCSEVRSAYAAIPPKRFISPGTSAFLMRPFVRAHYAAPQA